MIKLIKKDKENGVDNGVDNCNPCIWYEPCDCSAGITNSGCTHPILYDDNGDIIKEVETAILECLNKPRYCCLMERK